MAAAEERLEGSYPLGRKLWWLIFGRLTAAMLLLAASTIWTRNNSRPQPWDQTLSILSVVIGLTILYSLLHRFTRSDVFQARLQFAIDIILVTWLVWTSDVIHSPYTALYIVIISIASLFLGPRDVGVTSVGCAVGFTGCALAAITGLVSHPAKQVLESSLSLTIQSVGL